MYRGGTSGTLPSLVCLVTPSIDYPASNTQFDCMFVYSEVLGYRLESIIMKTFDCLS